jgi:hypothetical protein
MLARAPVEETMRKGLITISAVLTFMSLGHVSAQAGGATSAPSKYNAPVQTVSLQVRNHQSVQTADYGITEFSSSSAHGSSPKR